MEKKKLKVLLIVAVLVIIVLVLFSCGGNGSYEEAIDNLTEAFNSYDVEEIEKIVLEQTGNDGNSLEDLYNENIGIIDDYEYYFEIENENQITNIDSSAYSVSEETYMFPLKMIATPKDGGEEKIVNSFVSVGLYEGEWYFLTDSEIYLFVDHVIPLQ